MIRSMERDGPLATGASFLAVVVVVLLATREPPRARLPCSLVARARRRLDGGRRRVARTMKLNFLNFIALPITFGIGCEYPFNIFDRSRLLGGDVTRGGEARIGGAVALCSYTTTSATARSSSPTTRRSQSFGRLAMSGEIACLFAALFFLPSLLHLMSGKRTYTLEAKAE